MLIELLLELKMHGALEVLESASCIQGKEEFASSLLEGEKAYRHRKQIAARLKAANFSSDSEWGDVDPSLNPAIPFSKVQALGDGKFVDNKMNLCLAGQPGLGKSLSLTALGKKLCQRGYKVQFYTAHGLVTLLEEAQEKHQLSKLMKKLTSPHLLVIDEMGFVPFTTRGACLLFEVFSARHEKGSIAVGTNLSFDKWLTIFQSVELTSALLDRFTSRLHYFVYTGETVRTRKPNK